MMSRLNILLAALLSTAIAASLSRPAPAACAPRETVVLLHGLNRTPRSMSKMERALKADGYTVINARYPSRRADIRTLADDLFSTLKPQLRGAPAVHVVAHSLGGILLRERLKDHPLPNLGRVVMLGPPSQGSELADKLGHLAPYRWVNGPSGLQLGTSSDGPLARLPPPTFELGVIAGDRSLNPFLSLLIPGPDDGKVAVARAHAVGEAAFLRLPVTHTFMMRNRSVIRETRHFLKTGRFGAR